MKKNYLLITLIACLIFTKNFSQVITPFTSIYQATQKGGIVFLSNSALACAVNPPVSSCSVNVNEAPPSGTWQNDSYSAVYVDVDNDGSTFMSSSDSLNLPNCSHVVKAFLFWGASGSTTPNHNVIKLKVGNGVYQTITATASQTNNVNFDSYHCYADITPHLQFVGSKIRVTVADVPSDQIGSSNKFGSWCIAVVYKNDLSPLRQLNVFNGLANVSNASASTQTITVPLSGFFTPASGAVSFEVGLYSHDGDRSQTGDQIHFNGAGSFIPITDAVNGSNDIMNSTASFNGALTAFRKPDLNNTTGYDADIFLPNNTSKNYIGNSATSATFQMTSSGEDYLAQCVVASIDAGEPDLRTTIRVKDVNGGNIQPGDILEYTIKAMNVGSNPSINTLISDTLDVNVLYIPNSVKIVFGPNIGSKTDAAGDDQADYISASRIIKVRVGTGANASSGGTVNNSITGVDSTIITYSVTVTNSCVKIFCKNYINAQSFLSGTGSASSNTFISESTSGDLDGNGCPMFGPTSSAITPTNCTSVPTASNSSPVCVGGTFTLSTITDPELEFSWSGPNSYTASGQTTTITSASTAMSGIYTVTLGIPGSSCYFLAFTDVIVNVTPTITAFSSPTTICAGSQSTLNASGATNYTWNPGGLTGNTVAVNPITTTDYTVTGENPGCPTGTAVTQLSVNPVTIANAGPSQTLCLTVGTYTMMGNTATLGSGLWTKISGPSGGAITTPTLENTTITGLNAGVYVYEWAITNPPCTTTSQVTITIDPGGCDADNDGIANYLDLDDDNDGLIDTFEGTGDTDGDGIPDYLDLDSDNDGIPDLYESGLGTSQLNAFDANKDGVVDGAVGANGVPDIIETSPDSGISLATNIDSDGDAVPDYRDLDSDNDGIFDVTEAGYASIDTDNNGIVNGSDTDGDGIINVSPIDTNTTKGGTNSANLDSDGDNIPNNADLDSDNDAIFDIREAGFAALDTNSDGILNGSDTDGDGIINLAGIDSNSLFGGTGSTVIDTDGDGIKNFIDLDSDNDGILDITEAGFENLDTNHNGMLNGTDTDFDGIINLPGIDANSSFGGISNVAPETDGDVIPNYLDLDSDNDGIFDVVEAGFGNLDTDNNGMLNGSDTDGDGIINLTGIDNNSSFGGTSSLVLNSDGDSVANYIDLDSDNDGILDVREAGFASLDTDNNGIVNGSDTDGDGIINVAGLDANSVFGGTGSPIINSDGDSVPNFIDLDSDNDGISDITESGFKNLDIDKDGVLDGADTDNDGIINVPGIDANSAFGGTSQPVKDTDGDGVPNHLDLDSDNDGISDLAENGYMAYDTNLNGMLNGLDTDNDGIMNIPVIDNNAIFGGLNLIYKNSDNDTIPNCLDLDSDNDGIGDAAENDYGALDTDFNGVLNGTDTDGDGIINHPLIDNNTTFGGVNMMIQDADGDGIPNNADLDSDNDGISDLREDGNIAWEGTLIDGVVEGIDIDGDGIINVTGLDVDFVFGGVDLRSTDSDGDGIPNNVDLDSDNDGITDIKESGAGNLDTDNNGMANGSDTDGDGIINVAGLDNNSSFGGPTTAPVNTDGTQGADYLDIDSDNDGIVDNIEAQTTLAYIAPTVTDTDKDGIDDAYDNDVNNFGGSGLTPVNTDGTDEPDYLDLNSENDQLSDAIEGWDTDGDGVANKIATNLDLDGDGLDNAYDNNNNAWNPTNGTTPVSYPNIATPYRPERDWRDFDDNDNDGVNDVLDLDDDNDGVRDDLDGFADTDGDGLPNKNDLDSDNDGIPDVVEAGGPDGDGDGIYGTGAPVLGTNGWANPADPTEGGVLLPNPDSDNDGMTNKDDLDSDNDGIPDVIEAGGTDPDNNGTIGTVFIDTDGDGLSDEVDAIGPSNPGTPLVIRDTDNDGMPDYKDNDSDADGVFDIVEQGGKDADKNGKVDGTFIDTNGNGWADVFDPANGGTPLDYTLDCNENNLVNYRDPLPCQGIITVPQGFSPNNDGINDYLVIKDIQAYEGNELTVINRWGTVVYEKKDYDNTWNGKSNKGITIGGTDLPEGTYFYILNLNNGEKPLKGFIYLNRSVK